MSEQQPTRLIYRNSVKRGHYFRIFARSVLGFVATVGAYFALQEAAKRALVEPLVINIGLLTSIILGGWFAVRALWHFIVGLLRRSETLTFYNKGFVWKIGKNEYKYKWPQLLIYREGARGIYLFGKPLIQWGAHKLTMNDERVFKFRAYHGDARQFARMIRRYAAVVTSKHIGRLLRADRPVKLHRRLVLYPGGVEANGREIHWADLKVEQKGRKLIVRYRDSKGKMRTAGRFPIHKVDNAGGFIELAEGTLQMYTRQQEQALRRKGF